MYGHEGKCRHLHGHNYVALFTAVADALDHVGRVIDFSVLKEKIGGWIDQYWDHGTILWNGDREAISAVELIKPCKVFALPVNPTAENMAHYLLDLICPALLEGTGVRVEQVTIWETENCYAVADLRGAGPRTGSA